MSTLAPVCSYCKTYTSADANDVDSYLSNMYRSDCPSSTDANDLNSFLRNTYRPKFAPAQFHPAPNQSTLCCSTLVCNFCFARNISTRISRDFWFRLDTEYWAGCPSRACGSRSKFSVSDTLPVTLTPGIFDHVERYARAMACRDALQHLTPPPSKYALRRAAQLHENLILHGRMRDPMDPREPLRTEIKVLPVDSVDGSQTFQVPIFVNCIIPDKASSRECLTCCEAFQDVAYWPKTERNWAQVTRRFPGDWNYLVRPFMSPDALPLCSFVHRLDTCGNCLSDHIETQLQKGRSVVESLASPDPMYERIYTPEDVRKILNNPKLFSRYLKLRLLASLATLPNFSWCLRKGCEFGQEHVFPTPALPSSPTELDLPQNRRVFCHECGFSMCFTHQTPWHEGADCSQFGYGGDLVAASEAWIHQNTQRCPRCDVPVERTGGCFHVTCSLCRFEFCWLCLANWAGISVQDPYTYMATYRLLEVWTQA